MVGLNFCEVCDRQAPYTLEKHHLFPVSTRRTDKTCILVCRQCGDAIHQHFTNQQLQTYYHTLERIKEGMSSYIKWIIDKPITTQFPVAEKKRRR